MCEDIVFLLENPPGISNFNLSSDISELPFATLSKRFFVQNHSFFLSIKSNSFSNEHFCFNVNLMSDLSPPQNHQAKSILLWAMEHGGPPEKWVATQCLALSGVITDKVIGELVNHLHADNAVRTEKAGTLLAKLSQQSVSFPCDIVILI